MDSDQLDIIGRVASLGPVFYGQAYTWIKQYDLLILLIMMAGLGWFCFEALLTSPQPFWEIVKNTLFVLLVAFLFYKPIVFSSMSEYAPVNAAFEKKVTSGMSSNGKVVMAMPYPTYWLEKSLQWIVGICEAMVRGENRFIIAEPSNTAQNLATESAFSDSQLNGSTGAWSKVMGPALLQRYPALAEKLAAEKPPLTFRFLNPTSAIGSSATAEEARKVGKYIEDAGIDFSAVVGTNIGMTNAYTSPAINWSYADGKITAPLLEPATRSAKVAGQAPAGSNKNALAAFDKGAAVLRDAGDISKKPVAEEFTSMQQLYESLGNARDVASATTIGSTPEKVVIFGAACQAREAACVEKLAAARDNAPMEIRESGLANSTKAALTGAVMAFSAPSSAAANGMLKQMLPYFMGMVKGLAFLAMPVLLMMGLWAGRSKIAIVGTATVFIFLAIWNIFYVFYVGWGSSLFFDSMTQAGNDIGGMGRWANFAIEATVLGGMGMVAYQLVFSDMSRASSVAKGGGAGATGDVKKVAGAVNSAASKAGAGGLKPAAAAVKAGAQSMKTGMQFARMRSGLAGGGGASPPPGAGGGSSSGGGSPLPPSASSAGSGLSFPKITG